MPTLTNVTHSSSPETATSPTAAAPDQQQSHRRLSWQLRDAAQILVDERQALQFSSSSSSPPKQPLISKHFDTETATALLNDHRLPLVFDVAATTVLKAILKDQANSSVSNNNYHQDVHVSSQDLPQALWEHRQLQEQRLLSLERSHDNKEYIKRKGAKIDPDVVAAARAKPSTTTTAVESHAATSSTPPTPAIASSSSVPTTTTTLALPKKKKERKPIIIPSKAPFPQIAPAPEGPKFTRNTPASSAAALDYRFNSARAILCAAGNLAFATLTPGFELDVLDVPQNPSKEQPETTTAETTTEAGSSTTSGGSSTVNMGQVVVEAQTLGQRTIHVVENAVRRAALRYQYRKDNARYNRKESIRDFMPIANPWANGKTLLQDNDDDHSTSGSVEDGSIPYNPNPNAQTEVWQNQCLPRFQSVLTKGAGHAIYHDLEWSTRHGRIADVIRTMADVSDNFGPNLIITTEPEVMRFAQEFYNVHEHVSLMATRDLSSQELRVLAYQGSPKQRLQLRKYFSQASGLPEAPFHVVVTSYASFFQDYLHFCQLPFEITILDDGMGWMAAAQGDHHSSLRSIWDTAIFSNNDQHIGLAGTTFKEWDYGRDSVPDAVARDAWVGLTTRHRIITARTFVAQQRSSLEMVSVSSLVSFLAPHFADVVREEWDRSRIASDGKSMKHFRNLVARSVIVHCSPTTVTQDTLAVQALTGKMVVVVDRSMDPVVPRLIPDEEFVSNGKVSSSRRWTLSWLGVPVEQSWMRYELGYARFEPILDVMKLSNNHGHFCEEITTASSTTSSGACGQVAGTMAYRLAVRCGRHFGSEQGLRQHVSALHAPTGTWLCRTCSTDCLTSQARTHHERSCGQPTVGGVQSDAGGSGGATPIVGQGGGPKSGVGKKKGGRSGATQQSATAVEEKDPDGSFRVQKYRGVWINTAGKHFVKIDGVRLSEGSEGVLFFDSVDDAAKKYDEVVKKNKKKNQKVELNFKADGSRIVYDDITPASTSGLGGSAANVVPALSVINIKDLPPDVKPLLRDPRQTSRTGGNSKRHVYAYRGVCRQARKGHDRWQSQISFMGQNHYLGTFDSEWDAAAIYAWAHLILYGEEATRQAQKEGEEAAAAFEREKRDIAEGRIPEPPPKPEKKKKTQGKKAAERKKKEKDSQSTDDKEGGPKIIVEKSGPPKKRKIKAETAGEKKPRASSEKKGKSVLNAAAAKQKESIAPVLAKGVQKALILSRREMFEQVPDADLMQLAARKMKSARENGYTGTVVSTVSPAIEYLRPCLPGMSIGYAETMGIAMLLGISAASCGWDLQGFVEASNLSSEHDTITALQLLAVEYDEDGVNEKFVSIMQGTVCVIGCADRKTQQAYQDLGLGTVRVGGSVGMIDCHIGGVPGSCSESSACIRYAPTTESDFQIACLAHEDIVTVNGNRLAREDGNVPLRNGDICTVGARVFSFVVAIE